MKTWAFYKQNGNWHKIGVLAAVAREKGEPGRWRKRTYYSTHSPPSVRLKMHIRRSPKGKLLFAYNRGQEDEIERLGGGESLEHYLYKIAISELTSTSIKYGKDKKTIPIQITSSAVEHRVRFEDRYYDVDVFINFTSETLYGVKWSNQLAIEVRKTNEVQGPKLHDFHQLGMATIEVPVNKNLTQFIDEENCDEYQQRKHIDYIKSRLSEYIWSKILVDPKSKEYLAMEVEQLRKSLASAKGQISKLDTQNKQLREQISDLRATAKTYKDTAVEKSTEAKQLVSRLNNANSASALKMMWNKILGRGF